MPFRCSSFDTKHRNTKLPSFLTETKYLNIRSCKSAIEKEPVLWHQWECALITINEGNSCNVSYHEPQKYSLLCTSQLLNHNTSGDILIKTIGFTTPIHANGCVLYSLIQKCFCDHNIYKLSRRECWSVIKYSNVGYVKTYNEQTVPLWLVQLAWLCL